MENKSISMEIQKAHDKIAWTYAGGIKKGIYHNNGWSRKFINTIWEEIINMYLIKTPTESIILDAGCGNGQWIEYFRKFWNFDKIIGVDYSTEMLKATKKRLGNLKNFELVKSKIEDLTPINNRFYDIIHLYGVIEHLDDPNLVIYKCKKLLTEEGIIILNVPIKFSLSYISFMLFGISPKYWGKPKKLKYFVDFKAKSKYYRYYNNSQVVVWCKNAGLFIAGTIDSSYSFGIFPISIIYNLSQKLSHYSAEIINKLFMIFFLGRPAGRYYILKKIENKEDLL